MGVRDLCNQTLMQYRYLRWGFEPLTSAVQAPTRATGSRVRSSAARRRRRLALEPALGQRRLQRPARRERLERLARLDENRLVAGRGLNAPHDQFDLEWVELDPQQT
jgi:hypothetical protein